MNHDEAVDDAVESVDVVVIGAGIAGLAAAKTLVDGGASTVVLESRDRVGGRLLSAEYRSGGRVDLGATWFWPSEPLVQKLISRFDVAVYPQHLDGDAMFHQPDGAARIDGNPLDVPSGRFELGADALPQAIAASLPSGVVRLDSAVHAVLSAGDRLRATTAHGSFDAAHVVLALPPALAVDKVTFEPPLPERVHGLASATPVWMGATIKVVIAYARPFWREQGLSGSAISHIGPMRELHDISGPEGRHAAIFGFVPGQAAGEPAPDATQVVDQMVELFGQEAAEPTDVFIKDWRSEEWTSPPGVERLNAYQTYGHELYQSPTMGGRLHWASTETSTVNPGHIEGAIAAADRAAVAILNDLGQQRALPETDHHHERKKAVEQP